MKVNRISFPPREGPRGSILMQEYFSAWPVWFKRSSRFSAYIILGKVKCHLNKWKQVKTCSSGLGNLKFRLLERSTVWFCQSSRLHYLELATKWQPRGKSQMKKVVEIVAVLHYALMSHKPRYLTHYITKYNFTTDQGLHNQLCRLGKEVLAWSESHTLIRRLSEVKIF